MALIGLKTSNELSKRRNNEMDVINDLTGVAKCLFVGYGSVILITCIISFISHRMGYNTVIFGNGYKSKKKGM